MKTNVKYLPILIATLAHSYGRLVKCCQWWTILVENSSKTKINKLIDFIDEYVDNINTDSIVNIS
jgi:carboxyl-terminal processing protease